LSRQRKTTRERKKMAFYADAPAPPTPEYWWEEAMKHRDDAERLLYAGGSRQNVMVLYHGALERALRAIELERTGATFNEHSLARIASRAGLNKGPEALTAGHMQFLSQASGLHHEAGYPEEGVRYSWLEDDGFKVFLYHARLTYSHLQERFRTDGSGQNGSLEDN
jgi:hypothetical protein